VRHQLFRVFSFVALLLVCSTAQSADLYVSATGNDSNSGSQAEPFATLATAQQAARKFAGKESVTIHVADGIYYLPETLVFEPADSGTEEFPVAYVADNEGAAILSGGSLLDLQWEPHENGIYKAATADGLVIDQLFVNGDRQHMARYPDFDPEKTTEAYQGFAGDAFSAERAKRWKDPTGGYIHAMHRARWGGYHYRITGKKANGEVEYEGGWQNNRRMGMHDDFRMVENIFEELDAPGEWFHDSKSKTLFYKPASGIEIENASFEVVRLNCLIEFRGSEQQPVKGISIKGFTIRHAARTFMDTREPMLRSDWAIYRGGAVMLTGTNNISIVDCEFDQVGGNAIFVNNYNRDTRVAGCHIHDVGASGVCFVGDPNAVHNPLFEYKQKNDLAKIDLTPGPKTNNFPADGVVEDCLITGIGRVERQPAGVQIEMAMGITVRDCSIYDCARAGINVGDGCWGGHLIERCDVFDTVLETHDHGSFNSWGRDRFWHSDRNVSQKAIDKNPEMPFLDANKTTTIRNSRWRCDHGWDIDLDDGSSNYELYNNLMLHGGLKFREGFRRRAWNNIMVNNGFHPHVWYNDSGDELYANILMNSHRGVRVPTATAKGKKIDNNLFFSADKGVKLKFARFGWDKLSVIDDPLFIDAANGDFRVQDDSPALKLGFKNFPMDQFGVKKPTLKAIARTPEIPAIDISKNQRDRGKRSEPRPIAGRFWLDVELKDLKGQEFSAYGVRKEDGGVAIENLPANSKASNAGLEKNDLIQGVNDQAVKNTSQFLAAVAKAGQASVELNVIRNQQPIKLSVEADRYVVLENVASADELQAIQLPAASKQKISANSETSNQSLTILTDGKITEDYGPVFSNNVPSGAYKLDLGASKKVVAVSSWSFNQGQRRGTQKLTIYGSKSVKDPGWNLDSRKRFEPIGSIDSTGKAKSFTAASLKSAEGSSLGTYRWIIWSVSPVTKSGENTAFQEFAVETQE